MVQKASAIPDREAGQGRETFFDGVSTLISPTGKGVSSSRHDGFSYPNGFLSPGVNKSTSGCIPLPEHSRVQRHCGSSGDGRGGFQRVTCPGNTSVLLPPVYPNSPLPKPREIRVTLHYGELALHFTSVPARAGSLCTLISQRGALPVIIDFKAGSDAGLADASQEVAASVTTATLDIIPTRTGIRRCNFFLMKLLSRADVGDSIKPSIKPLPDGTNECYLNTPSSGAPNGLTVKWSIPGFEEYAHDESGPQVYRTRALTYYTDLNSLLAVGDVCSTDSIVIDRVEDYIHRTLIKNLPAITPIGLPQVVLGA